LLLSASKENDLLLCIYFWYHTDSGVPDTSIYSAVSLTSPYYNYLSSTASTTMICWCCHSNSVNTGSRLPRGSDVKTRKRRNVVGIDMIRNNRIGLVVSEEKIFGKVYDGRWRTPSDGNSSHGPFGPGELTMSVIHEIEANDWGNWTQNLTMNLASQYFLKSIWIAHS
jgi:hypothetical protein